MIKSIYRIPRDIGPPQNRLRGQKIEGGAYIFRNFKFKSLNNHFKNLLRDNELEKGAYILRIAKFLAKKNWRGGLYPDEYGN